MHSKAVHIMGLSNMSRETIGCKNLIAAWAYGLGGVHGNGGWGMGAKRELSLSRPTNKSQPEVLKFGIKGAHTITEDPINIPVVTCSFHTSILLISLCLCFTHAPSLTSFSGSEPSTARSHPEVIQ